MLDPTVSAYDDDKDAGLSRNDLEHIDLSIVLMIRGRAGIYIQCLPCRPSSFAISATMTSDN